METILELLRDETVHPIERILMAIQLAEDIDEQQDILGGLKPTRRTILGDLRQAKADADAIGETVLSCAIAAVVQATSQAGPTARSATWHDARRN